MRGPISTDKLNCFHQVCVCRSFRDAASKLGIAQSALSRKIQALEADLGMVLLHRTRTAVVPTEAGQRLFHHATEVLRNLADIRNDLDHIRGHPCGEVSLALPASFATAFLSDIIPSFTVQYPDVRLRLLEGSASQIEELLLSDRADLGIIVPSVRSKSFNQEILISDQLYIVGRQEVPGASRRGCSIKEIANLPLVLPLQPYGTRRLIDGLAERHKVVLKPILEADSPHILKQLVMALDLYTIMPGISFAEERARGELKGMPLSPTLKRELATATVAGRTTSFATRVLAQHIKAVCQHRAAKLMPK